MVLSIAQACFVAWCAFVSIFDIKQRRVPNWLVAIGLLAGLLSLLAFVQPNHLSIAQAMFGFAFGAVLFLPLYVFRAMGAGDVKVFAVLGLWTGAGNLVFVWMGASLIAGVHALMVLLLTRTSPLAAFRQANPLTASVGGFRGSPYAAFMCLVALALFCRSNHLFL